jgi:hypothetical protein
MEPFAIVRDHSAMLSALRQRIDALGTTFEAVDDRAGLQSNYCAKILGPTPLRRASPFTLFLLLEALGVELHLHETPGFNSDRLDPRKARKPVRRQARIPGIIELTPDFRRWRARAGGEARARLPNLSDINRRAALTRWRRYRERRQ